MTEINNTLHEADEVDRLTWPCSTRQSQHEVKSCENGSNNKTRAYMKQQADDEDIRSNGTAKHDENAFRSMSPVNLDDYTRDSIERKDGKSEEIKSAIPGEKDM